MNTCTRNDFLKICGGFMIVPLMPKNRNYPHWLFHPWLSGLDIEKYY